MGTNVGNCAHCGKPIELAGLWTLNGEYSWGEAAIPDEFGNRTVLKYKDKVYCPPHWGPVFNKAEDEWHKKQEGK